MIPQVTSLTCKKFRSLQGERVQFVNPTFLVGKNGAGKSNLVDVFAFLAEAMTSPLQAVFERRGGVGAVGTRRRARGRLGDLGIRVDLRCLNEVTQEAWYAFELRFLKNYGFEVRREQCVTVNTDGTREWFDRNGLNFRTSSNSLEPKLNPNALALTLVGGDARFTAVQSLLSEMAVYRIEPMMVREMQDPDDGVRLNADGRNAASVLREIRRGSKEDWKRVNELVGSIVPSLVDVNSARRGNKLVLEFTQRWGKEPVKFDAFGMSDGTLRAVGLLAAVYQRPAPSVLVIEEPEATTHPEALGTVLDLLRHAARFMQVIVTTHSPDVLDAEWIESENIQMMLWEKGTSRVVPIADATRETLRRHLAGAGELLRSNALTPSEPTAAPDVLFEDLA